MNVFLQYIMFCDWGTIFCLEIANCKHVKTLIGNNSEKLAGNNNFVKTCNKPEKLARNNDFVKTLIGNYSEKLARNNDGWKKDNARAQQTMEANNHLLILVQIPAWDISVRIQKGDKYKYKNWQMQIQKLTYTRTKNEKFCRISFFHANLGLYNGLHVCTCYTAQQVYPEDKFNVF